MTIIRSWREQKAMLRMMFPNLSDEDFQFELSEKETMIKRLQKKLKKTKEEIDQLFKRLEYF